MIESYYKWILVAIYWDVKYLTKYGMGSSSIQYDLHRIINQKIIYNAIIYNGY
jgi:hypothetical protein